MSTKKVKYVEPVGYFSKETRKKFKIGEFAEPETDNKKANLSEVNHYIVKENCLTCILPWKTTHTYIHNTHTHTHTQQCPVCEFRKNVTVI